MKYVLLPVLAPDGDKCWEAMLNGEICGHFDNEGGHATCTLDIGDPIEDPACGYRKPPRCLELMKMEGLAK